jgi:hypothetical protein
MTNPSPRDVIARAMNERICIECGMDEEQAAYCTGADWSQFLPMTDHVLEALRSRGYALGRDETIKRARELMALWDRVIDELDEGKPWEEIDCGFREPGAPYNYWHGYMTTRLLHSLRDILHEFRATEGTAPPAQSE